VLIICQSASQMLRFIRFGTEAVCIESRQNNVVLSFDIL